MAMIRILKYWQCNFTLLLLLLTAVGLSPGGSRPTLVQTKVEIHKATITTKQLQNSKITTKQ